MKRIATLILSTLVLAACSHNDASVSATESHPQTPAQSLSLVLSTESGSGTEVSPEMMEYEDTAIALSEFFDAFAYDDSRKIDCNGTSCTPKDPEAAQQKLCYKGDINQVCSLLSKMSKLDAENYSNGYHGLSHLEGCRTLGRGKPVQAVISMINDYSDNKITLTQEIGPCAE